VLSQQILSYFECCFILSAIFVNENKKILKTKVKLTRIFKNGNEKMQNEKLEVLTENVIVLV